MPYVLTVCLKCDWFIVGTGEVPPHCERCGSPYFWYYRSEQYPYVLSEWDKKFLKELHIESVGSLLDGTPLGGDSADRPDPLPDDGDPTVV